MNKGLLHLEVQKFIYGNLSKDLSSLILKGSPFPEVSIQEIAAQIEGIKTAKKKFPVFFNENQVLYPPKLNLEQTSSEITARYKAKLVSGKSLIDVTGGLGIDTYFFSEKIKEVTHCEYNTELSALAQHNFKVLKAKNISCFNEDGIEFLKTTSKKYDWIYIDPSRRDSDGSRVFFLDECFPNIPENLDLFFQKGKNILVKTSPLLDLKSGLKDLQKVEEIHIISVNNEVKELLWILNSKAENQAIIKTVDFEKSKTHHFNGFFQENKPKSVFSEPLNYLYEPNAAIMKSGLFAELAHQTGTYKLHQNSQLFTSEKLTEFPGRRFKISQVLPFSKKSLKRNLKKANITTRNFPKSVKELRKELKIADGGTDYLFFTTNLKEEKVVLVCEKL